MSTGSRWNNQGFVSPTMLRRTHPSPLSKSEVPAASETGELSGKPPHHTRTPSLFSFTSKRTAQQQAQQATSRTTATAAAAAAPRSPPSTSGHPQSASQGSTMPPPSSATRRTSVRDGGNGAPPPQSPNSSSSGPGSPGSQREIKSVLDLALAHAHKVYFSGPLVRRLERLPDGTRPTRDEGWVDIWAQLGGTTLSVWDMKAIEEASKRGEEVPPSYINVTDSFIQVLGALTSPATATTPAKRFTNVITLNTAGSNLILLACPSSPALIAWATALRLASWEKSRLEEIYTGHLLRMSLSEEGAWREPASTLVKGRLEGNVKVRIAGHTDWKPMWMVITSATGDITGAPLERAMSPTPTLKSKKRLSSLFGRSSSEAAPPPAGSVLPTISLYASNKSKDLRMPLLTMRYVSQAFAVFPERVEVISRSTLLKLEGLFGEEDLPGPMKGRHGWMMVMPDTTQAQPAFELLKWLVAIHDVFSLYGRPASYVWDPRQPDSMWYAYPVGAQRVQLFVKREEAETLDPRDDRTAVIRKNLKQILVRRTRSSSPTSGPGPSRAQAGPASHSGRSGPPDAAPVLPPLQTPNEGSPQIPPFNFLGGQQEQPAVGASSESRPGPSRIQMTRGGGPLAPISEANSIIDSRPPTIPPSREGSGDQATIAGPSSIPRRPTQVQQHNPQVASIFTNEPIDNIPRVLNGPPVRQGSEDSDTYSRPDSKLAASTSFASPGFDRPGDTVAEGESPILQPSQTGNRPSPAYNTPTTTPPLSQSTSSSSRLASRAQSPTTTGLPHSPQAMSEVATTSTATATDYREYSPAQSSTVGPIHTPPVLSQVATTSSRGSPSPPSQILTSVVSVTPLPSSSSLPPSPPPKGDTEVVPNASATADGIGRSWPRPPVVPYKTIEPDDSNDLANEAGALYVLQQQAEQAPISPPGEAWATSEDDEEQEESDISGPERNPPPRRAGTPPVLIQDRPQPGTTSSELKYLGRKPSGARANPSRRFADKPSLEALTEPQTESPLPQSSMQSTNAGDDDNADALAALSFLQQQDEPPKPPAPLLPPPPPIQSPKPVQPSPPPSESHFYPSSFAPSKQAAERKAKAQAQQEATYAATHRPGKPNGKGRNRKKDAGAWAESSDEEEEDDDDEDEEDEEGSEEEAPKRMQQPQPVPPPVEPKVSVYPSAQPDSYAPHSVAGDHGQARPRTPRTLPLPPTRTGTGGDAQIPPHSRGVSFEERPRTQFGDEPKSQTMSSHIAARQSVWSTVLDPQPAPRNTSAKDTFVQVDESETMTKAFQPQGLLSAGLQDKEDRSAKRQEELARETGASLINVPNKPPPPQTGLLGAITAHERERKREGGVGAALTEKERERRLAEERQRKLDELQRQQIDQLSQGGGQGYDFYGQQYPGYGQPFDPRMTMNPMLLNPYMAGGFPMMPFGNPQQMMAAQLAAQQAYQQAMMSFSQAGGSQAGDHMTRPGPPSPAPPSPTVSPMPTGNSLPPTQGGMMGSQFQQMQGGMAGMDPRMSMMAPMNMMMGGAMGMNPMMGMGMGMGMGQNYDPRASMGQFNYPQPGSPRPPSFRQGSPAPARSGSNSPRPNPTA